MASEPKCPHCRNDDVRLIEHIRNEHYRCEVCSKNFDWKEKPNAR